MAKRFAEAMHNTNFDGKEVSDCVKSLVSPNVIGKQLTDIFKSVISSYKTQDLEQA